MPQSGKVNPDPVIRQDARAAQQGGCPCRIFAQDPERGARSDARDRAAIRATMLSQLRRRMLYNNHARTARREYLIIYIIRYSEQGNGSTATHKARVFADF